MKKLVAKIKSWFKDRNDRKDREFLERTRIKMEKHEDDKSLDKIIELGKLYTAEIEIKNDDGSTTKFSNNQAEKMRELAEKNRNNKPFYKDDKAKEWEQ